MQVDYVKYRASTGEIRQWGYCEEGNPIFDPAYVELDLKVLVGAGSNNTHYVDLITGSLVNKPVKPSEHHIFDYTIKQWVDPRTAESQWVVVRKIRDQLLTNCDWTQLPDVPIPTKESWANYRQALRDVSQQSDPFNIVWPDI